MIKNKYLIRHTPRLCWRDTAGSVMMVFSLITDIIVGLASQSVYQFVLFIFIDRIKEGHDIYKDQQELFPDELSNTEAVRPL